MGGAIFALRVPQLAPCANEYCVAQRGSYGLSDESRRLTDRRVCAHDYRGGRGRCLCMLPPPCAASDPALPPALVIFGFGIQLISKLVLATMDDGRRTAWRSLEDRQRHFW